MGDQREKMSIHIIPALWHGRPTEKMSIHIIPELWETNTENVNPYNTSYGRSMEKMLIHIIQSYE